MVAVERVQDVVARYLLLKGSEAQPHAPTPLEQSTAEWAERRNRGYALRDMGGYVKSLPDDDSRVRWLSRFIRDGEFEPDTEFMNLLGRINADRDPDAELDHAISVVDPGWSRFAK